MTTDHARKGDGEPREVPTSDDVDADLGADRDVDESEGQGVAGGARGVAVGIIIRGGGQSG